MAGAAQKQTGRQTEIDILKGIGILSVILYHTGWQSRLTAYVSSFHMVLFFCTSGFFYRRGKMRAAPKRFAVSKARALLRPYIVFVSIYTLVNYAMDRAGSAARPVGDYLQNFLYSNLSFGATWFLLALLLCVLVSASLIDLVRNPAGLLLMALGVSLLGYLGSLSPIPNLFRWQQGLFAVIFFVCGYLFRQYLAKRTSILLSLVCIAAGLALFAANGDAVFSRMQFGNHLPVFIISALLSTLGWYYISCILSNYPNAFPVNEIAAFGEQSLVVLLTHQLLLKLTMGLTGRFLPGEALRGAVTLLVVCALEYLLVKLYRDFRAGTKRQ